MGSPSVAVYGSAAANRGGTGVYTERLLQGFRLLGIESVSFFGGAHRTRSEKLLEEHFVLSEKLRKRGFDLVHLPAFGGRPVRGIPYAVTVHDMAFLDNPAWFSRLRGLYYRHHFPVIARKASLVIADSDFTRSRIKALLGISSTRVYLSAPLNFQDDRLFRSESGIRGDYVIYTGTIEPRKNIGALLDAWPAVSARHPGMTLVVAGRWGWEKPFIKERLEMTPWVVWTGPLPVKVLMSAVAGARLMVYPSLYEGFGLPPLEAAAAGVPVTVGPAETLREIYGDIAASVSGSSAESIAEAILEGLETPRTESELRDFARGFSLENTSRNTWDCYLKALE